MITTILSSTPCFRLFASSFPLTRHKFIEPIHRNGGDIFLGRRRERLTNGRQEATCYFTFFTDSTTMSFSPLHHRNHRTNIQAIWRQQTRPSGSRRLWNRSIHIFRRTVDRHLTYYLENLRSKSCQSRRCSSHSICQSLRNPIHLFHHMKHDLR